MPSSGWSGVVADLCRAPGWMALAGWRRALDPPDAERPLADGVPTLVLSVLWTLPLAVLCGPTLQDWWMHESSSAARAGLLLAVLAGLLAAPWPLGYAAGRLRRSMPAIGQYASSLCRTVLVGISGTIAAPHRWARDAKHYLPGAGATPAGYVVARASAERRAPGRSPEDVASARRQLEAAWDV